MERKWIGMSRSARGAVLLGCVALFVLATGFTQCSRDARALRVLVFEGDPAPGEPPGTVLTGIRDAEWNDQSYVSFISRVFDPEGVLSPQIIWMPGFRGVPYRMLTEYDPLPEIGEGVLVTGSQWFKIPGRRQRGGISIPFNRRVGRAYGVVGPGGEFDLLAWVRGPVAGLPNAQYEFIPVRRPRVGGRGEPTFFAYVSGEGIDSSNDEVVVGRLGVEPAAVVAQTGMALPDLEGATILDLEDRFAASHLVDHFGRTTFVAQLQLADGSQPGALLRADPLRGLETLIVDGDPIPFLPDEDATFAHISTTLGLGGRGDLAFVSAIFSQGRPTFQRAIFVLEPPRGRFGAEQPLEDRLRLVAREGSPVPIPGLESLRFSSVSFAEPNGRGDTVFVARMLGEGSPGGGLFVDGDEGMRLIATQGQSLPGLPDLTIDILARNPKINEHGDVLFGFFVADASGTRLPASVWGIAPKEGGFLLLPRLGDEIELAPGDVRPLRALVFPQLNDRREILLELHFDGGLGVFCTDVPRGDPLRFRRGPRCGRWASDRTRFAGSPLDEH